MTTQYNNIIFDMSHVIHANYHAATYSNRDEKYAFKNIISSVRRIYNTYNPTSVDFCFDYGKNFRSEIYPPYKGDRPDKPIELDQLLDDIRDYFSGGLGYSCYFGAPYEADDYIGSLIKQNYQNQSALIITGDKDLQVLVDDYCHTSRGMGRDFGNIIRYDDVVESYGIKPELVSDYLALVGDTADGFPGVAGIGSVAARELLNEFGSYNNIFSNIDDLPSKYANKIKNAQNPEIWIELANLVNDINLPTYHHSSRAVDVSNKIRAKYNNKTTLKP